MINKNSNSLQDAEENVENQKKNKTDLSIVKDKQLKNQQSLNKQLSKRRTHLEKPKKSNTPNKITMIKNSMSKANKGIMYNDTVSDIDNISCELINDSFIDLNINNELESIRDISRNKTITPKSSPISVILTPQRTTKTPRKSPLHLTSPKTHCEVPLRISKTPRKLILSKAETKFNNSEISLQNRKSMNNSMLRNASLNNIEVKQNKLKTNYTSTENLSRLSKSPKIILRSSNTKSKCKSSDKKLSNKKGKRFTPTKVKKSPNKDISEKVFNRSKKSNKDQKSLSSEASDLDLTLTNVNNLSVLNREIISKKPMVILEKIPLLDNLGLFVKSQNNQYPMNSTFDVKHVQKQLFTDPSSLKNSPSINILSSNSEVLSNTYSLNLTPSPQIKLKLHLNDDILRVSPKATSSPVIDNKMSESIICLDSTNKINKSYNNSKNNTITINNKETNIADETYELLEPKTPNLQQQCRKRKAVEIDINDKRDIKRACKVRFAASESHINKSQTTVLKMNNTELSNSISTPKTKHNNITIRKTPIVRHISHKRSSSVSNDVANKSKSNSEFKRRSSSMSNINRTLHNNSKKMDKTLSSTINKTKHIGNEEKKGKTSKKQLNFELKNKNNI